MLHLAVVVLLLGAVFAPSQAQQMRLVDGGSSHRGSVQIFSGSQWLSICDDGFGFDEADAVCRDLGFEGADRYTWNDHFGSIKPEMRKSNTNFLLDHHNCTDTIGGYRECPLAEDNPRHDCATTEVAGVECRTANSLCEPDQYPCQDGANTCIPRSQVCNGIDGCLDDSHRAQELCSDVGVVRLMSGTKVNIPGATLGSVQVKASGKWGVMCDDRTSEKEAKVICRSLGYKDGWSAAFMGSSLGEASGPMTVDSPECTGNEQRLGQCPRINFGITDCPENGEDFGVFCYDEGVEVRLSGNGSPDNGQVELKMSGQWGTVCGSGFDILDAQVICRMLGYEGDAIAHRGSGRSNVGLIWNLRLDCLGKEQSLQDCRIRAFNGTCSRSQTASVTCSRSRGQVDSVLRSALGNPDCGVPEDSSNQFITRAGKVLGGIPPSRFDTPWLISLRRARVSEGRLYCGGSIISEDYIITAAHCLDTVGRLNVVIRVGDYNSNFKEDSEEEFLIDKVWVHEYADEHAFNDNDIALIKIERKNGRGIRFGLRVKPICLPSVYDDYDELSKCTVAGWGPTFFRNEPESRPREGNVGIISDYTCEGGIGGASNFTSSIVCVGSFSPRVNACRGDSGGPLACPVDGKQTLYGLVSSGRACTFSASADLYTRVSKFVDWILEKVQLSQRGSF